MIFLTAASKWWRRLPRVAKVAGYIGAISGAVVTTAAAWPIVEFVFPAHRGYVTEQKGPLLRRVIRIELRDNETQREQLLDEFPKREIELQSEQAKQNPQYRRLIQDRLNKIKSDLEAVDKKHEKLLKERGR